MKRLKLECKPLDVLLEGGFEYQSITEIYGEAGTGKTNICLQAARECSLLGKKTAYIDSEGVSIERLQQISEGYNFKKIFSKIIFLNPVSLKNQERIIKNTEKINNLGLIVLDTFNMFHRIELEEDEKTANRSLNRQITNLQLIARKKDIPVIIAGQVYTSESGEIKPFAGRGIEHMAKTVIRLDKIGVGRRQATIIKHRSIPEGKKTVFTITQTGLA
ncbi:MAG: DNA repair and recombination protein RadB [Spirochaetes bacterium]|nr:MAG: DNA repair and recombination protein RadB [Spirochaetota bacterium]